MPKLIMPIIMLFQPNNKLLCVSKHTIPDPNPHVYLSCVVDNKRYTFVNQTSGSSLPYILTCDISHFFQNGVPSSVILITNSGHKLTCLICFNDIPANLYSKEYMPDITFSLCNFQGNKDEYMTIHFAKKSNCDSPTFALGRFKVRSFIDQLRERIRKRKITFELDMNSLWEILINDLLNIGYFGIFDHNHFQTIVLLCFQKMLIQPEKYRKNSILEQFYSFIQTLLSNNSWFLIVGENIHPLKNQPSQDIIKLFLNPVKTPSIHFVDIKSCTIGLSIYDNGYISESIFLLVVLDSTEVRVIRPNIQKTVEFDSKTLIIHALFPHQPYSGPDIDYDSYTTPRGKPETYINKLLDFKSGMIKLSDDVELILFKTDDMSITAFIELSDGTYNHVCPYFIIMLILLSDNNELSELTMYLRNTFHFIGPEMLVEALLDCGFEPIFNENATTEQIQMFFHHSIFVLILTHISFKFNDFEERLLEHCKSEDEKDYPNSPPSEERLKHRSYSRRNSIRQNPFVCDLKLVFKCILERVSKIGKLGPEIEEILSFLRTLLQFLEDDS